MSREATAMSRYSPIRGFAKKHGTQLLSLIAGASLGVGLKGLTTSNTALTATTLALTAIILAAVVVSADSVYRNLDNINQSIREMGVEILPELTVDANKH